MSEAMMAKHFANVLTEYLSPEISNQYIRMTLAMSDEPYLNFSIVDNSSNLENFERLSTYYTNEYEKEIFAGREVRRVELEFDGRRTSVLYIRNNKNSGYGAGCNLAMRAAIDFFHPDYLIVSNNDMMCEDSSIALSQVDSIFKKNPELGIIGVNIRNLDGSAQSPYRQVSFADRWLLPELFYPFSRRFKKHTSSDLIQNPEDGIVYRVRGSFMILRTKAFEESGGFDEKLFLYGEEPVLAERMRQKGYSVYHFNGIHMLHNHVMDGRTLTNSAIQKIKQRFNSELYYYETYRGVPQWQLRLSKLLFAQYYWRFAKYEQLKSKRR